MKVLLINPPYPFEEFPTPPFGLISLAAYLIEKGVEVIIEDYIIEPYSQERLKYILDSFKPHIAGSTAVTMNAKKALSVLKDCKEISPSTITVMGGPHASFDAENILAAGSVDYIVRGEGEITFTELIKKIESGEDTHSVDGTSTLYNGKIIHNRDRTPIPDINILPYPARHLAALSKYRAMGFPINMITSKGCPHSCIFCVGHRMVGNKVRYYDIKRVVDEFELLSKMGFHQINIVDDLFTSNKKRCMAICDEIIARGIRHNWSAFARVDTVSEDLLIKLKEAGCETLCFGIESGNQEILDRVKKRTTLARCHEAAELCRKTGIKPMAAYILGLPGETEETVLKTLEFAENLGTSYGFHILAPFPGTEVREKSVEYGIKILTDDWDLYDANRAVCDTGGISPEKINSIADNFNAKIKQYFEKLSEKKTAGAELKPEEYKSLQGIESFVFNRELLTGSLVEKYPGLNGDSTPSDVIGDFTSFISSSVTLTPDAAAREIERLIELNCINVISHDRMHKIAWSNN